MPINIDKNELNINKYIHYQGGITYGYEWL